MTIRINDTFGEHLVSADRAARITPKGERQLERHALKNYAFGVGTSLIAAGRRKANIIRIIGSESFEEIVADAFRKGWSTDVAAHRLHLKAEQKAKRKTAVA